MGPMTAPKKLTAQQRIFVTTYAKTFLLSRSAKEAGVTMKTALEWINNKKFQHLQQELDALVQDREAQRKINEEIVIGRTRGRLIFDFRELVDSDGKPKNPRDLPLEVAQHIQSYSYSEYNNPGNDGMHQHGKKINIRLTNADAAARLLAKAAGLDRYTPTEGDDGSISERARKIEDELDRRIAQFAEEEQ